MYSFLEVKILVIYKKNFSNGKTGNGKKGKVSEAPFVEWGRLQYKLAYDEFSLAADLLCHNMTKMVFVNAAIF